VPAAAAAGDSLNGEIYLRRLAEAEIRRPGTLTRSDLNAGMARIHQAAFTLRAVGLLTDGCLRSVTAELTAALAVRSDLPPQEIGRRMQQVGLPRDDPDRPAVMDPLARWLDISPDGSERLVRLDLTGSAEVTAHEQVAAPGERLLAIAAERILASACGAAEPVASMDLRNTIEVLTGAGAIAPDSPAIGRLAALCDRLGITSHGVSAAATPDIPAPWISVLDHASAALHAAGEFAPLGTALPLVDGNRFVLAGLSVASGESFLVVVASGPLAMPPVSWWVRDSAGDWHVAVPRYPEPYGDEPVLRLQLVPPLDLAGGTVEVVVTGSTSQVRAVCRLRLPNR
jgi:hypothetical protein